MKRISFSARETLIEEARRTARCRGTTLSVAFREWLLRYVEEDSAPVGFDTLTDRLKHARSGRPFSRDEMNER